MAGKQRSVIAAQTFERPPETVRTDPERDLIDSLILVVGRPLWAYRVEMSWLVILAILPGLVWWETRDWRQSLLVGFLEVGIIVASGGTRRGAWRLLRRRDTIRRWETSCRYAGLVNANDQVPPIMKLRETRAGWDAAIYLPGGLTYDKIKSGAEASAQGFGCREVRVSRSLERADRATVSIIKRDVLAQMGVRSWPWAHREQVSLWEPVPVGIDEHGETVSINLVETNLLIGGEPGGGKSVAMQQIVAAAALDASAELFLMDGKLVELANWSRVARANVGECVDDAIDLLRSLQSEMKRRYEFLLDHGVEKISREDGLPIQMLICDELACYVRLATAKQKQVFETCLTDIVARGRAAGIIGIFATQKPTTDVVPSGLRDLIASKWAMRCTTPQASDAILGQGYASNGINAQHISTKGVGFLLSEGGLPKRLKSFLLSRGSLKEIAGRSEQNRGVSGGSVCTSGTFEPAVVAPEPVFGTSVVTQGV